MLCNPNGEQVKQYLRLGIRLVTPAMTAKALNSFLHLGQVGIFLTVQAALMLAMLRHFWSRVQESNPREPLRTRRSYPLDERGGRNLARLHGIEPRSPRSGRGILSTELQTLDLERLGGLEPPTFGFVDRCSSN